MIGFLIPLALKLGKGLLGFAEKRADAKVEGARIQAGVDIKMIEGKVEMAKVAASVVTTGMQFKAFWVPWLMATIPLSAWFAWGTMDSMIYNGAILPDIAELPPQLKEYADTAWQNLFYTGGGVAGAQMLAKAIERRK